MTVASVRAEGQRQGDEDAAYTEVSVAEASNGQREMAGVMDAGHVWCKGSMKEASRPAVLCLLQEWVESHRREEQLVWRPLTGTPSGVKPMVGAARHKRDRG